MSVKEGIKGMDSKELVQLLLFPEQFFINEMAYQIENNVTMPVKICLAYNRQETVSLCKINK